MSDPTEITRRKMVAQLSSHPRTRLELEAIYSKVWNTDELSAAFTVLSFCAPFCAVQKKDTDKRGTVMFQHDPRYYFNFIEDSP